MTKYRLDDRTTGQGKTHDVVEYLKENKEAVYITSNNTTRDEVVDALARLYAKTFIEQKKVLLGNTNEQLEYLQSLGYSINNSHFFKDIMLLPFPVGGSPSIVYYQREDIIKKFDTYNEATQYADDKGLNIVEDKENIILTLSVIKPTKPEIENKTVIIDEYGKSLSNMSVKGVDEGYKVVYNDDAITKLYWITKKKDKQTNKHWYELRTADEYLKKGIKATTHEIDLLELCEDISQIYAIKDDGYQLLAEKELHTRVHTMLLEGVTFKLQTDFVFDSDVVPYLAQAKEIVFLGATRHELFNALVSGDSFTEDESIVPELGSKPFNQEIKFGASVMDVTAVSIIGEVALLDSNILEYLEGKQALLIAKNKANCYALRKTYSSYKHLSFEYLSSPSVTGVNKYKNKDTVVFLEHLSQTKQAPTHARLTFLNSIGNFFVRNNEHFEDYSSSYNNGAKEFDTYKLRQIVQAVGRLNRKSDRGETPTKTIIFQKNDKLTKKAVFHALHKITGEDKWKNQ